MQKELQLRWRNVTPSEALDAEVREEAHRLERFHARITGCEVTLESPSRHHRNGAQKFHVRIELTVPGGKIVVARDHVRDGAQTDLYVAVRQAFREARRQLQDHVGKLDARIARAPRAGVATTSAPRATRG